MKFPVSIKLIGILIISVFAFDAAGQIAEPCKCPDGGEHRCPKGYSACCWWDGKKCSGACIGKQTDAKSFAAKVASVIKGETVTVEDLSTNKKQYGDLFTTLMKGKKPKDVYQIEYEGRTINFRFTKQATDQINVVTTSLKADGNYGPIEASKPIQRK